MFSTLPLIGETDTAAAIGARLVSIAGRAGGLEGRLCLRALAAVAPGSLGVRAARAASSASGATGEPGWFGDIGAARATRAWRASDVLGDQDSVMVGFTYPDGSEHALLVLIDHLLGGIAKDAGVFGVSLSEVLDRWGGADSDMELVEEPVGVAAARVIEAMDWTDHTVGAPITDDYRECQALLRARFEPLAAPAPQAEALDLEAREQLVRAFLGAPEGEAFADEPDAWFLLDALVDYRCDQHDRDPLCWSGGAVELFLLHWVPRKLAAADSTLRRAPEVLRAWLPWAARRVGLPDEAVDESLELIDEIEGDFLKAIADQSNWGPAKGIAMKMLSAGVDISDVDAANRWLVAQSFGR